MQMQVYTIHCMHAGGFACVFCAIKGAAHGMLHNMMRRRACGSDCGCICILIPVRHVSQAIIAHPNEWFNLQVLTMIPVNFTGYDLEEFFGLNDDTSVFMMLVWILPVIIFVFYGQRIQLYITSGEIKKSIKKLDRFRQDSRDDLVKHVRGSCGPGIDPDVHVDRLLDYFTIPPVDMDPGGIVPKIRHVVRSREEYTRRNIKSMMPDLDDDETNNIQTLIEIATTLQMFYKTVNHLFLTAKKQNNYPLILPLQMMLPFIMEEAVALRDSFPAFRRGQPVGDGIGPMVVGSMMRGLPKEDVAFQTVAARTEFEGRRLVLLKAKGPSSTVGRLADALDTIMQESKPDAIIMIDAALRMEGEDSAAVSHGFGAAIGGIGTERFQIEEAAVGSNIPVFAIIIKQSVKEALTLMTKEIAQKASDMRRQTEEMVRANTNPGDIVVIMGVGNTAGVPQ